MLASSASLRVLTVSALLLAVLAPAAAQGPATIHGQVYACSSGAPVPGAVVRLHDLDNGTTIGLIAGKDGRFSRVGLTPGRYLISATAPRQTRTASRLARLETDDVLTFRIGTDAAWPVDQSTDNRPHPACDTALIPQAPPMSSRYIIR